MGEKKVKCEAVKEFQWRFGLRSEFIAVKSWIAFTVIFLFLLDRNRDVERKLCVQVVTGDEFQEFIQKDDGEGNLEHDEPLSYVQGG